MLFAIGSVFGALGPAFYDALIGNGPSRTGLFVGYLVGAGIMLIGGLIEVFLGVSAGSRQGDSCGGSRRRLELACS